MSDIECENEDIKFSLKMNEIKTQSDLESPVWKVKKWIRSEH